LSKIKVNEIVNRNGSSITIGDANTSTVVINSGTTLTGFSSTGIDDNATSTAITIDSSGNVGIGTLSANSRLHLKGAAYTALTVDGTAGGQLDFYRNGLRHAQIFTDNAGGDIIFRNNSISERMRINSSGNVGIGTSSPFGQLLYISTDTNGGTGAHSQTFNLLLVIWLM
jgi:hypothetical protein